jgi:hypothetical protein
LGEGVFHRRGVTIQAAEGEMVLIAVLDNEWGEDELRPNWGECST